MVFFESGRRLSIAIATAIALVISGFQAAPARADGHGAVIIGGAIICAMTNCLGGGKKKKTRKGGKRSRSGGTSDLAGLDKSDRRLIQEGLAALGFYDGAIDGSIGGGSRTAIKAYQGAIGAKVTGVMTPEQVNALAAASPAFASLEANDPMIFGADLKRDLNKEELRSLQVALNNAGYIAGTPDGSWGGKTRAAVTAYKADKGLAGKAVATRRLSAHVAGVPFDVAGGRPDLAAPDAVAEADPELAPGQAAGEKIAYAEEEEAEAAPIEPVVARASEEKFSILDIQLGMTRTEVEDSGLRSLGEGTRIDLASFGAHDHMPRLDRGHLMVQPAWPQPGTEAFVSYYASDAPDLGALGVMRLIALPADYTYETFESEVLPNFLEAYGSFSRVGSTLTWVGNAEARETIGADAKKLEKCGRLALEPNALLDAEADKLGWSFEASPALSEDLTLPVYEACGETLHLTFAEGLLQIAVWNSNALISEKAGDAGSVMSKIKF